LGSSTNFKGNPILGNSDIKRNIRRMRENQT
jgi:hypothetical protein